MARHRTTGSGSPALSQTERGFHGRSTVCGTDTGTPHCAQRAGISEIPSLERRAPPGQGGAFPQQSGSVERRGEQDLAMCGGTLFSDRQIIEHRCESFGSAPIQEKAPPGEGGAVLRGRPSRFKSDSDLTAPSVMARRFDDAAYTLVVGQMSSAATSWNTDTSRSDPDGGDVGTPKRRTPVAILGV
jgi:hypothetical protein